MAERTIEGKDILFWIDPLGGTDYQLVACLLTNDFSGSTGTTDSSSKCGDSSSPGTRTSSWSITGQVLLSPTTDPDNGNIQKISAPDLFDLWAGSTVFSYFAGRAKANEIEDDWSLQGTGFFSAFGWTNPNGDKSQFSATVTNSETPESIIASGES